MTQSLRLNLAFAAADLAFAPPAVRAQVAKPSLYTADQGAAGIAVYTQACASCHGAALEGVSAPALKGTTFGATAQSLTVDVLLDVIASSMPQTDPGSLNPEAVNAVTA